MKRTHGFTIIEVMLVLAISSLMALLLMVGTGVAIQRQQYRDSVQSFENFLVSQYARVVSVENDRTSVEPCPILGSDSSPVPRGQSNCVIIGRYIATMGISGATDGREYEVRPVYAAQSGATWTYRLGNVDATYTVSWSARTRLSNQTEDSAHVAILMYRDPDNGGLLVRTNSGRYNADNIGNFFNGLDDSGSVVAGNQLGAQEICVYDRGWLPAERRSVFLGIQAGSSDAVTVGNATGACDDQ